MSLISFFKKNIYTHKQTRLCSLIHCGTSVPENMMSSSHTGVCHCTWPEWGLKGMCCRNSGFYEQNGVHTLILFLFIFLYNLLMWLTKGQTLINRGVGQLVTKFFYGPGPLATPPTLSFSPPLLPLLPGRKRINFHYVKTQWYTSAGNIPADKPCIACLCCKPKTEKSTTCVKQQNI